MERITIEDLTLKVVDEIHVRASIEKTFEALLEQLGPLNESLDKGPIPMKLDLGADNGHCWATVQAIKRPTLLEFYGPLFMSYPVSSNVQYRLTEEPGGTLIKFRHIALGLIEDDHRKGVVTGWGHIHKCIKALAERVKPN